jgi:hypothetical protein
MAMLFFYVFHHQHVKNGRVAKGWPRLTPGV